MKIIDNFKNSLLNVTAIPLIFIIHNSSNRPRLFFQPTAF